MKVYREIQLSQFEAYGDSAVYTLDTILNNGKENEFDEFIDTQFPYGLSEVDLNDLLRDESDMIFKNLGIKPEEEEE